MNHIEIAGITLSQDVASICLKIAGIQIASLKAEQRWYNEGEINRLTNLTKDIKSQS